MKVIIRNVNIRFNRLWANGPTYHKIQIVKDNYIIGVPQHVGAKWKDIGWGVQAPPVRSATTRDGHGRECDGDGKCLSSTKGERL